MAAKKKLLIIISSDPRESDRAAEGIRVAAGLGLDRKIDVSVLLEAEAKRCVSDPPEDLIDGENFNQYLPLLSEAKIPICIKEESSKLAESLLASDHDEIRF
jgi:hypothetical protein